MMENAETIATQRSQRSRRFLSKKDSVISAISAF